MNRGAVRAGFFFGPGSLRLCLLRLGILVGLSVPGFLLARAGLTDGPGSLPRLAHEPNALTIHGLRTVLEATPIGFLALSGFCMVAFWLAQQLLNATAVTAFDPQAPTDQRPRVWQSLWSTSWGWVLPFTRITLLTGAMAIVGLAALGLLSVYLLDRAELGGWLGVTRFYHLPAVVVLMAWVWLETVGTLGLWCRVIMVSDGHRRLRRVVLAGVRALWRAPGRGLAFGLALRLVVHGLGAVLLVVETPGRGQSAPWFWWSVLLLLQMWVWHWRTKAARRLYHEPAFEGLHQASDLSIRRQLSNWTTVLRS